MKEKFRYSYKGAISKCSYSFDAGFGGKFPIDFVKYEERKEAATYDPFNEKTEAEKNDHKKKKCIHRTWRFTKTRNEWYCVTCGFVVTKNPFLTDDEESAEEPSTNKIESERVVEPVKP